MKGDCEGAVQTIRNARPDYADALAAALLRGGPREYWRQRVAHMNGVPYAEAVCYAMADDSDEAFEQFERAFAVRQSDLTLLYIDPRMDSLRGDRRFDALARRIGLPQVKAGNAR